MNAGRAFARDGYVGINWRPADRQLFVSEREATERQHCTDTMSIDDCACRRDCLDRGVRFLLLVSAAETIGVLFEQVMDCGGEELLSEGLTFSRSPGERLHYNPRSDRLSRLEYCHDCEHFLAHLL